MNLAPPTTSLGRTAQVPEPVITWVFWVPEEKALPVDLIATETARRAPVHTWRIVTDESGYPARGDVQIELTGTPSQIKAFRRNWERTLFTHSWLGT